jgi:uncharacterized protein DUF3857
MPSSLVPRNSPASGVRIPQNHVFSRRPIVFTSKPIFRHWLITVLAFATISLFAGTATAPTATADDWLPISPEELKMTAEPKAPGAPAINLYRQVDRDDQAYHETNYVRIKILTEEGRKYGDVSIPLYLEGEQVNSIRARTIRPDGSVANFDGKFYMAPIVKGKDLKIMAKTFTLPDVQVGSIIEYRYTSSWQQYLIYDSRWILSDELYTKHARFTLKPATDFAVTWSWNSLPAGTSPPKNTGNVVALDSSDIPAFHSEDFMPPENELKSRVDFIYSDGLEKDPDKFWKKQGKKYNDTVESFVNKRKAMEEAVAGIVSPSDSPEVKARKIYARVLQIHNTSMDVEKTEQEQKRDKQKEINNVEDMWKRGYGNGRQVDWLYLALLRAAGLEAYEVYLSPRDQYFFNPRLMNTRPLTADVVLVKLDGKEVFCDPGSHFAPFGIVPWQETGVKGLRLDKEGGTWIQVGVPELSASRIERKADLKATTEGSLEGKLTITFTGLEAEWRRISERLEDDPTRKKFLEDQVREYIPVGIEIELTNKPDWNSSADNLVAEYDLKVPGWISGAGKRALLPVGLFSNTEKHIFEHTDRVYPIYFTFPFRKVDNVSIELPLDWKVSSMPAPQKNDAKLILYTMDVQNDKGTLHVQRTLDLNVLLLEQKFYPSLRSFFQAVKADDELQIVLQPGSAAAQN